MIALAQPSQLDITLNEIIHGEALAVLKTLPECCIDSIVCDPPAGISFMGREFDHHRGGRDQWIAWLCEIMTEALRCLKPGGHAFVWALPRTSHWTATALEDAGFEIRDVVVHLFGSGFPKSHDISKAIDRMKGTEREVIGFKQHARDGDVSHQAWTTQNTNQNKVTYGEYPGFVKKMLDTLPATPEALAHAGEGTALKPAHEHWILCRKPLSEPTIAANVLKWGTGALRIDDTRVGNDVVESGRFGRSECQSPAFGKSLMKTERAVTQGRWPANVILTHSLWCVQQGTRKVKGDGHKTQNPMSMHTTGHFNGKPTETWKRPRYNDEEGQEEIANWQCTQDCPVAELDRQSGVRPAGYRANLSTKRNQHQNTTYGKYQDEYTVGERGYADQGGASRYFHTFTPNPFIYQPKPSRRERNNGCEGLPYKSPGETTGRKDGSQGLNNPRAGAGRTSGSLNSHPTVKSITLMRHLIRQITPPGGIVLDCFAGSGSTLVAAIHEGMHFIGIEMNDTEEEPYVTIARARIEQARREVQYA